MIIRFVFYMLHPDMIFVQNFTLPDFQATTFTLSILHYFNSFSDKTQKKMSENGEIYTAGKHFTLPPAVTALTMINHFLCIINLTVKRLLIKNIILHLY